MLTERELKVIHLSRTCLHIWIFFYFINIVGDAVGIKVDKVCSKRGQFTP